MSKLYFATPDADRCHTLSYMLSIAKEEGLREIELYEAVPQKVDDMFYCRFIGEPSPNGECGKICDWYEPKNGKSGMCRYKGKFHEAGKKVKFKVR